MTGRGCKAKGCASSNVIYFFLSTSGQILLRSFGPSWRWLRVFAASCPLDFVGVAGVNKPGLKGEWVIRGAHLVFHGFLLRMIW